MARNMATAMREDLALLQQQTLQDKEKCLAYLANLCHVFQDALQRVIADELDARECSLKSKAEKMHEEERQRIEEENQDALKKMTLTHELEMDALREDLRKLQERRDEETKILREVRIIICLVYGHCLLYM